MQNFGVTKKEHHGMLKYFLEWPIGTLYKRGYLKLIGTLIIVPVYGSILTSYYFLEFTDVISLFNCNN